jgi:phage head maturation protease
MDLIALHDGRPGLRTLLQVEASDPVADSQPSTTNSQPTLDFVASTATLDRYHEVIEPAGWRLESYRRNPVFQNAHNYGNILFTLGKALVTEVRGIGDRQALCQRIEFATEVNPVARIAYGLYKGGFLRAVSVGFIPLRWEDGGPGAKEATAPRRRYLEQELLEVSAVAIPANPDALALGLKSGAVAKSDLKETAELLRALLQNSAAALTPALFPGEREFEGLIDLARELGRVMRKA